MSNRDSYLRVATFNTQYATPNSTWFDAGSPVPAPRRTDNQRSSRERAFIAAIRQLVTCEPDVVVLEELDVHQARSGRVNLARLAARTLAEYGFGEAWFAPMFVGSVRALRLPPSLLCSSLVPAGTVRIPGFGLLIASREPLTQVRVIRLPRPWPRFSFGTKPPYLSLTVEGARVALAATLRGRDVNIAATHLAFRQPVAARQLTYLWESLRGTMRHRIIAGDLNMRAEDVTMTLRAGTLTSGVSITDAPTFPSHAPRLDLDHIVHASPIGSPGDFSLGSPIATLTNTEVLHLPISDHRALVTDVHVAQHHLNTSRSGVCER